MPVISQPAAGELWPDESGVPKELSILQAEAGHSPPKVSKGSFLKLYRFKKTTPTTINIKTKKLLTFIFFVLFTGKYIGCFLMFYFQITTFFILMGKKIKYLIIGGWDKRGVSFQNKTRL